MDCGKMFVSVATINFAAGQTQLCLVGSSNRAENSTLASGRLIRAWGIN